MLKRMYNSNALKPIKDEIIEVQDIHNSFQKKEQK